MRPTAPLACIPDGRPRFSGTRHSRGLGSDCAALMERSDGGQTSTTAACRPWLGRHCSQSPEAERSASGHLFARSCSDLAIAKIHADPFFTAFATTREEEAIGVLAGAWMGGMRGTLLMQTSGFATLANVLASLIVPNQIPAIMFVTPGVDAVDGAVGETFWPRGGLRRGTPATSATRSRSQVCERWPISLQI